MSRANLAKGELKIPSKALQSTFMIRQMASVSCYPLKRLNDGTTFGKRGELRDSPPKKGVIAEKRKPKKIQDSLIALKQEQPSRSINTLIRHLRVRGEIGQKWLSRSSVYRFLKNKGLSKQVVNDSHKIERRALRPHRWGYMVLGCAPWSLYYDAKGAQKTYLISFLDDKSRFVCHSGFYFTESALSLEHAFKEALLKEECQKNLLSITVRLIGQVRFKCLREAWDPPYPLPPL